MQAVGDGRIIIPESRLSSGVRLDARPGDIVIVAMEDVPVLKDTGHFVLLKKIYNHER